MPRPFLYVGSLGPLPLHEAELSRLYSLGNVLAEHHLVGLFNVDFVRNDDGLWPVEVTPLLGIDGSHRASHRLRVD